ncbi:hypothetical protein R6Q57_001888 [Mikania cordata]
MVKLATARESRTYGPGPSRNRAEYINAGVYVFSTIVLMCGFVLLLLKQPKLGLVLILVGLALIVVVNIHDLMAHLAGIDYRVGLMELDVQLPLVEVAVPVVQALGAVVFFMGILFLLLIQGDQGHNQNGLEAHAVNLLIAGAVLWVVGSILNSCQIYERADGHVQILQQSVHIPFLTGSFLFMVGAILNDRQKVRYSHHGLHLLVCRTWVWMGMFASLLLLIGGLANVIKVFKMLQIDGLRLEKLRGGAQERLVRAREGQTPFLRDERRRWPRQVETTAEPPTEPTPYKDVLLGKS